MEKISEEISKKVISLDSGDILGYVLDVLFDEELKKILGYLIVDDESEEIFLVKTENIYAQSNECFVIGSGGDLELYISSDSNNPIGKPVYDRQGLRLGNVVDVEHQKYQVKKIITSKCEFPVSYLAKAGKDCLIFGKHRKKTKSKFFNFTPNLPKVYIEQKINDHKKLKEYPVKLIAWNDNIIGKKVTHDVFGLNNEIVAKKGDRVTKDIIKKAKIHNRYNLLMFYID